MIRVHEVELDDDADAGRYREKLARVVLDHMFQFVALLDTRGNLLEVNRAALEGGGIRFEDVVHKPFWEARWWTISEETQTQLRAAIDRAAAGEFVRYDVEVFGGGAGSETIVIDFSINPVRDHEGCVVFLLPEGRNISEKKRAEAELAQKNEELERLLQRIRDQDELKSAFFANISHELRTPLSLILGPAEKLLADGATLTEPQRRDLAVIRRNAATLLKHVNDLLDVSKLEASKATVHYEDVDLAHLVRFVAGHFDALAAQRGMRWTVGAPNELRVEVEAAKIERVLLNVIANAFKFSPDGAHVSVLLDTVGDEARIAVSDSGPGVREEMRARIFERFGQGDAGHARRFGGTGLGLSIAKEVLAMHGGSITVDDAPGGGAVFVVTVPIAAPQGTDVSARENVSAGGLHGVIEGLLEELSPSSDVWREGVPEGQASRGRVLVVEDHTEMNRFVCEALARDFDVVSAVDSREALNRVGDWMPDLVITDIMMPGMGGDVLAASIRQHPVLCLVPVLVLSAKADDALRVSLLRGVVQDYMTKPFATDELVARARNLVSVKRARDLPQEDLDDKRVDLEVLASQVAEGRRRLRSALDEKDALLRELQHRVRNDLQIMASVLGLQLLHSESGDAREALDDAQARVHALALAHNELAGAGINGQIELRAYVARLVEQLEITYRRPGLAIRCDVTGAVSEVDSDVAILCGIVVTELVTNAVKHAFRERTIGHVGVAIEPSEPGLRITVRDDGIGLAGQPDASTSGTLGMQLATVLTRQLGSRLEVVSETGTTVTFQAPRSRTGGRPL